MLWSKIAKCIIYKILTIWHPTNKPGHSSASSASAGKAFHDVIKLRPHQKTLTNTQ